MLILEKAEYYFAYSCNILCDFQMKVKSFSLCLFLSFQGIIVPWPCSFEYELCFSGIQLCFCRSVFVDVLDHELCMNSCLSVSPFFLFFPLPISTIIVKTANIPFTLIQLLFSQILPTDSEYFLHFKPAVSQMQQGCDGRVSDGGLSSVNFFYSNISFIWCDHQCATFFS